jgi:hypothetical protein
MIWRITLRLFRDAMALRMVRSLNGVALLPDHPAQIFFSDSEFDH